MNTGAKDITTVEHLPAINPLMILQGAIEKGIDADQLEKLMALQERWEANQARKAFDSAMADFQANCPIIEKTRRVDKKDGSLHYWYAPLDVVLRTIRPYMGEAGLSVRFNTETVGPLITAICTVSHRDGHSEVSHFSAPVDEKMYANETQKTVSANSYARRTALMNALNLSATHEDDDGKYASQPPPTAEQVAAHEKAKAKRPPQDPASIEQITSLKIHLKSDKLSPRDKTYITANLERMTKTDAAGILHTLKLEQSA